MYIVSGGWVLVGGVAGRMDDNNRFSGMKESTFTKIGHAVRAVDDVRDAVLS